MRCCFVVSNVYSVFFELQILMSVQLNMIVAISVLTQMVLTHVIVVRAMYLMTMAKPALSVVERHSQNLVVLSTHLTGQNPIHPSTSAVSG